MTWLTIDRDTRQVAGTAFGDRAVGKESGETAHIERFNNTLRQRCPVMVRKTLSFSKNEAMHEKRVRIFIDSYNKRLSVKKKRLPNFGK